MDSLFGVQKRLLGWLTASLDWACDRTSYVTTGRPIYVENSVHVWRSAGPRPVKPGMVCGGRDEIELSVTCVTCCGTTPTLWPDGTVEMPTPDEWESTARIHENDVARVYGLLKHHAGWLGSEVRGNTEADPDSETSGGCFGTTIRMVVPWTAPKICVAPPVEPPVFDDDGGCC